MSRLLHLFRTQTLFIAALSRLLLLLPLLSGEILLSMFSIAGLTLTTLPPLARLYRRPQPPQLEQRIEKEIFDECTLSHAIRAELERAAQLLPRSAAGEEIIEAEWEETAWRERPPLPHYPQLDALQWGHPAPPPLPRYPRCTPSPIPIAEETVEEAIEETVGESVNHPAEEAAEVPLAEVAEEIIEEVVEERIEAASEAPFEESLPVPLVEAESAEPSPLWLPARERADALLIVCQLYSQLEDTEIPLTILIGGSDEDELLQLSSESLDGAVRLKEQVDECVGIFGFDDAQTLFDHLFYCSIRADRNTRLQTLLSTLTPMVVESMVISDPQPREALYQQIFDHLFEAGEFLSSEREQLFAKWHEEFIPPTPPEESLPQPHTPQEAFAPASESTQERIAAALENLQQQQELELSTPEQQQRNSIELEREQLNRKRRISRVDSLARQQGLALEQLLQGREEESEQLLNLLLSARSDPAEEYLHFHDRLKGTPADLLIESLLRIKLQNRSCLLYRELRHLDDFEQIEQQILAQLTQEFGSTVVKNHRRSIEQDIEWASSSGAPHCGDTLLPQHTEP